MIKIHKITSNSTVNDSTGPSAWKITVPQAALPIAFTFIPCTRWHLSTMRAQYCEYHASSSEMGYTMKKAEQTEEKVSRILCRYFFSAYNIDENDPSEFTKDQHQLHKCEASPGDKVPKPKRPSSTWASFQFVCRSTKRTRRVWQLVGRVSVIGEQSQTAFIVWPTC